MAQNPLQEMSETINAASVALTPTVDIAKAIDTNVPKIGNTIQILHGGRCLSMDLTKLSDANSLINDELEKIMSSSESSIRDFTRNLVAVIVAPESEITDDEKEMVIEETLTRMFKESVLASNALTMNLLTMITRSDD